MAATLESVRKAIGKKGHSSAFAWLADFMRKSGDLDGALLCIQDGLQAFPDNLPGLIIRSSILYDLKKWDDAASVCEEVLRRDPYCLSVLRRLGSVCEKKGEIEKRNTYFQRLHDLDPLDPFWKEEYAPVAVENSSCAVSAPSVPEEDVKASTATEKTSEPLLDESFFEKDPALDLSGLPRAEASLAIPQVAVPAAVDKREKSPSPSILEKSHEPDLAARPAEDDPFSSLATLLPTDDSGDGEISFDNLEHSLDDAIAGFAPASNEKEFFPTDEISGGDVSSAISGIFGSSDSADDAPMPTLPSDIKMEDAKAPADDEPKSLSAAFDDIFGADELPEEFVPVKPGEAKNSADNLEMAPAAPVTPLAEESSEGALNSGFKDLGDIPPVEEHREKFEKPEESSLFSKSLDSAESVEEKSEEKLFEEEALPKADLFEKSATNKVLETAVDSSFDSLFGKDSDDVPDMPPVESAPKSESVEVKPAEETTASGELKVEEENKTIETAQPAEKDNQLEKAVDSSFEALFGNGDEEDDVVLPKKESLEGVFEKPTEPVIKPAESASKLSNETLESAVDSSFSVLFGKDDDSPIDLSLKKNSAEETPWDKPKEVGEAISGALDKMFPEEDSGTEKTSESSLNTKTLAEIYFGQGLYDEAIGIYKDLIRRSPSDESLKIRLEEIEKIRKDSASDSSKNS
ncbi:MAG: hypothetical protein M0P13_07855 [Fibrobacteraceae bacterium]|nr:hypothetical protein [Fibrobacteraceae bacterium]